MINKTQIKYIQSLHQKKFRDQKNVFFAETPKVVHDLITSNYFPCLQVYAVDEWIVENAIMLNKYQVKEVIAVTPYQLEKISALMAANAVLAIFERREPNDSFVVKKNITLALDGIQDPGNLGTIIRIADWFGVKNIVCSEGTADIFNPKVVQSTMGSLGRVNILYTNLENWLAKKKGVKIYATALDGKPLKQLGKIKEGIFIIGSEGRGISENIMSLASEKITIEKVGKAESLNAAVACGIVLSHVI